MTLFHAIILGLVQGLAEFLPISSSGHLAILEQILQVENAGMVFDVMLHFGTLVAIFVAFWADIKRLVVEGVCIVRDAVINVIIFFKNFNKPVREKTAYRKIVNSSYRKFVMLVIVSTIPTGILGIVLESAIGAASSSLIVVGICLFITGGLLLLSDIAGSGTKHPKQVTYREAGVVGIVQGLATFPGISRSGSTITACLLCGFDKSFAVKYSFIMSVPAVLGAVILQIKDFTALSITGTEMLYYAIGTLVAAVVGYICIKTMLVLIRGKRYKYFAYYCFLVGAFSILWELA